MNKYMGKYRIPSARLQSWDYGANGAYFITICTLGRINFFGAIKKSNGEAQLVPSEIGDIPAKYWEEIPQRFPFVELGNFVVMPNHIHGIIIVDKNSNVKTRLMETDNFQESENRGGATNGKNPMLQENVSRVLRWYKGRCTFEIRKQLPEFNWQSRFYDHVIRNNKSFERIQNYIENNPREWKEDCFY